MSVDLYARLEWLPPPRTDFSNSCRSLGEHSEPGDRAATLATFALDVNQLSRLGRTISRLRTDGRDLSPLRPFKLGLLGNGTLDFLAPALVASAARHGFLL